MWQARKRRGGRRSVGSTEIGSSRTYLSTTNAECHDRLRLLPAGPDAGSHMPTGLNTPRCRRRETQYREWPRTSETAGDYRLLKPGWSTGPHLAPWGGAARAPSDTADRPRPEVPG